MVSARIIHSIIEMIFLVYNNTNNVYVNVKEGQKRVESILKYAIADPMVMHTIGWTRFGDLTRIILLANICIKVSEDLFNKLKYDPMAGRHLPRVQDAPEITPINPDGFVKIIEDFLGKMLPNESKKLHLDMIEGKYTISHFL